VEWRNRAKSILSCLLLQDYAAERWIGSKGKGARVKKEREKYPVLFVSFRVYCKKIERVWRREAGLRKEGEEHFVLFVT